MMSLFRKTMFKRIIPNCASVFSANRVRPHYERAGILAYEPGKAATDLTATELPFDAA